MRVLGSEHNFQSKDKWSYVEEQGERQHWPAFTVSASGLQVYDLSAYGNREAKTF